MNTGFHLLMATMFLAAVNAGFGQPSITTQPADQALALGATALFRVYSTGTSPLSYQWRCDGVDLSGATSSVLSIRPVQLTNAGGYTVLVTNAAGAVTSRIAQLSVAQVRVHTNAQGRWLTYYLFVPRDYDPVMKYPLVLFWHGGSGVGGGVLDDVGQFVFLSATNQVRHPCLYVAPQIPQKGDCDYNIGLMDQVTNILGLLLAEYSVEPNRLYVTGRSLGGGITWGSLALYPELFAAAVPHAASWPGLLCTNYQQDLLLKIQVPVWQFHAADDGTVDVRGTDETLASLRNAGANPIYTRYQSGGHGISPTAYATPGLVDWVMAQRRGVAPTNQPLLSITTPTTNANQVTALTALTLRGAAFNWTEVLRVTWTNIANHTGGTATGTNYWSAEGIPLQTDATNLIVVTAWSTNITAIGSGRGGYTTFSDTLTVIQSPIRADLTSQGTNALLTWTGGGPPYRVQRATDLLADDWSDVQLNARSPVTLSLDGRAGFYRILGQ